MSKLLLMSMLIATIVIPARHCDAADAKLGLRKALIEFAWFSFFYMLSLRYVVWRFL